METTDLIFAVDSIPAILAITTDPFLVYTSNVFAILGLRALYFALAGVMAVLVFVGFKMISAELIGKIPRGISLGIIAVILAISVAASLRRPQPGREPDRAAST